MIESRWGRDFPHWPRPALRPSIQWVPAICQGVSRPGSDVDHPPPPTAEVQKRVELYPYSPLGFRGLFWGELCCRCRAVVKLCFENALSLLWLWFSVGVQEASFVATFRTDRLLCRCPASGTATCWRWTDILEQVGKIWQHSVSQTYLYRLLQLQSTIFIYVSIHHFFHVSTHHVVSRSTRPARRTHANGVGCIFLWRRHSVGT